MNILVTGISGRIGANLAKGLLAAGHTVRGLIWPQDRRLEKLCALDVDLIEGTLTDAGDVQRAVEGMACIYHLGAAFQGGGPFSNEDYFEINVRGTFNMLEAALNQTPDLQHFFFASSDALYRKYIPGGVSDPIHEDKMPLAPGGMYALSKQLGEDLCRGYQRNNGLPVTIFRFALAVAGDEILRYPPFRLGHWRRVYAGMPGEAAAQFHQQLQALDEPDDCLLLARDEQGRSYKKHIVDVRDLVGGMLAALDRPDIQGEAIQLAAPAPFTWEETIPYLAQRLERQYVDVRLPLIPPTHYEFDLTKCRTLLGYEPQFDMMRMIDSALAFEEDGSGVIPTHVVPRQ